MYMFTGIIIAILGIGSYNNQDTTKIVAQDKNIVVVQWVVNEKTINVGDTIKIPLDSAFVDNK